MTFVFMGGRTVIFSGMLILFSSLTSVNCLAGVKAFMFRVRDLREGVVTYHHSDSDSTQDHIVFRISDGQHSLRHRFPINILPKDDSPPFLINNVAVEVQEGGAIRLEEYTLLASDLDSNDDFILYQVVSGPQVGQLIRRSSAHEAGGQTLRVTKPTKSLLQMSC